MHPDDANHLSIVLSSCQHKKRQATDRKGNAFEKSTYYTVKNRNNRLRDYNRKEKIIAIAIIMQM